MVNALYNERYRALENIAYHPRAERFVEEGPFDEGYFDRDWEWEATSMREIALAALKVEES